MSVALGHCVIRPSRSTPRTARPLGPAPERRTCATLSAGRARRGGSSAARAPGTLSHLGGCHQAALDTPLVGAGRSRVDVSTTRSRPRHVGWRGAARSSARARDPPRMIQGFDLRSTVPRPVARARRETDSHAARAQPPRASSSCVLPPDEADRRRINPASTRSRPVARERDAWTTMHRRRQSDIQIAHQHVTIQHDHRKTSDFCPRGRTTRLSLCADHPFIRHVCLSPATWLSPACPERTPSF